MIALKSKEDIQKLAEGGAILGRILKELVEMAQPGVTGQELDAKARQLIAAAGTKPAFLGYGPPDHPPFPAALCVSINSAVVHGIPTDAPLSSGDVVGLDLGLVYKGMFLDAARTVAIGPVSAEAGRLMAVTKEALRQGIAAARVGNTLGDIGQAVQSYVEGQGFGVVRALVGHGVGYDVHEDPPVPNWGRAGKGLKIQAGLVIAIEPMVTIGDPAVAAGQDDWTIVTASGNLAAHEEHTVAVTAAGPQILTV